MRLTGGLESKGPGLKSLMNTLAKANGLAVKVGVLGKAGDETSGASIVDIALIHELGSPKNGIPERSFLRSTFTKRAPELGKLAERMAKAALKGQGVEQSLNLIGSYLSTEIKKTIAARIAPANAQSTIDRKKSDVPLVNTGQLLNSVTWEVTHTDGVE